MTCLRTMFRTYTSAEADVVDWRDLTILLRDQHTICFWPDDCEVHVPYRPIIRRRVLLSHGHVFVEDYKWAGRTVLRRSSAQGNSIQATASQLSMKTSSILFGAIAMASSVFAAPVVERATCTNPSLRKSWNDATTSERSSYIKAVLCLATKPSKLGHNTTLYDDFTYVHATKTPDIHNVGSFLPWHRYFIQLYENELRACNYTGYAMYWDWETAANTLTDVTTDLIFNPTTGFGGNGKVTAQAREQCVQNGPFVNLRPAWVWSTFIILLALFLTTFEIVSNSMGT